MECGDKVNKSLNLLIKANSFLDDLSSKHYDQIELESNIAKLREFRVKMEEAGFANPYKGGSNVPVNMLDADSDQLADIKKQISKIKYLNYLKKITLGRIKSSLAAHVIARSYEKNKINHLLNHLPYDGNYIDKLSKSGIHGYNTFKDMSDQIFEVGREKYVLATVKYVQDGADRTIQVKVKSEKDLTSKVKRAYGDTAEVIDTHVVKKPSIIRSGHVRTMAMVSFCSYAADKVAEQIQSEDSDNLLLLKYNHFLKSKGITTDVRLDLVEGFDELKDELVKEGLMTKAAGQYFLDRNIASVVSKRKKVLAEGTRSSALGHILFTLFKHYMTTNKATRENSNLYPTLLVNPDVDYYSMFDYLSHTEYEINNAAQILDEKFTFEKYGLKMDPLSFGAALFVVKSNKDVEWVSKHFDVDYAFLVSSVQKIKGIIDGQGRGKEFLKMVKDVGSKRD